jgi:hypothetical protein
MAMENVNFWECLRFQEGEEAAKIAVFPLKAILLDASKSENCRVMPCVVEFLLDSSKGSDTVPHDRD